MTCQKLGFSRLLPCPPWVVGLPVVLLTGDALAAAFATPAATPAGPSSQTSGLSTILVVTSIAETGALMALVAAMIGLRRRSCQQRMALTRRLEQALQQADMAEVAAGVLHNVGNVLNSVNASAAITMDTLGHTRASRLREASQLLLQNEAHLAAFLTSDSRGRLLPQYLADLADVIDKEQTSAVNELRSLTDRIEHIRQIISTQQNYAQRRAGEDLVQVQQVIDDAVRINLLAFDRHGIDFVVDCSHIKPIIADKHRLLQILTNLISNAKHALASAPHHQRMLTITATSEAQQWLRIDVIDNGVGIAEADLERIFEHGFTRRPGGHGFGLHSARLAAEQMGGSLTVASDGPGTGATFSLRLPLATTITATVQQAREVGT